MQFSQTSMGGQPSFNEEPGLQSSLHPLVPSQLDVGKTTLVSQV